MCFLFFFFLGKLRKQIKSFEEDALIVSHVFQLLSPSSPVT